MSELMFSPPCFKTLNINKLSPKYMIHDSNDLFDKWNVWIKVGETKNNVIESV